MKNKKGFTLVELLAVIVLLGVLIGIAVPSVLGISKKVKEKMRDSKLDTIEVAIEQWAEDNKMNCYDLEDMQLKDLIPSYIKPDDKTSDDVKDPVDNKSLNEKQISDFVDVDKICGNFYIAEIGNYKASNEEIEQTEDHLESVWSNTSDKFKQYVSDHCEQSRGCSVSELINSSKISPADNLKSEDFEGLPDKTVQDDYYVNNHGIFRNRYQFSLDLYKSGKKYGNIKAYAIASNASTSIDRNLLKTPSGYHYVNYTCPSGGYINYSFEDDEYYLIVTGMKQNITCSIYFEPGIATSGGY